MKLKEFLRAASKQERAAVAVVCRDSVPYLYQLAGRHRFASALMALRLEERTREVAALTDGRLRSVLRESLVRHPEIFGRTSHEPRSEEDGARTHWDQESSQGWVRPMAPVGATANAHDAKRDRAQAVPRLGRAAHALAARLRSHWRRLARRR